MRECERFGHELAQGHVQVRDDGEAEDDGDRARQERVEEVREQGFAHGSQEDREERDAELGRRDEADGVVDQLDRESSPRRAGVDELAQTGAPRGHERVLGHDEERVPQDHQENRDYLEENGHAPLPGAWVLGGISSNSWL